MSETPTPEGASQRAVFLTVLVAALGYFVDIYDLILFSIIRGKSLKDLGLNDAEVLKTGLSILSVQMVGMLIGGILWGVLGDRRGRLSVLFGSIVMYSLANLANGMVTNVEQYYVLRFVAGIGLAGELGAGITLVSEVMSREARGFGTTLVAAIGILGAVLAAIVSDAFSWRTAYYVGGFMGLALLALRVGLTESGLFAAVLRGDARRGDFFLLFRSAERLKRYLSIVLMAVPIWYVIGILITASPEIGKAMGMTELPKPGKAVMLAYIGLSAGDIGSGWFSQLARSRKRAVGTFIALTIAGVVAYFTIGPTSLTAFYACCTFLGFGAGYWAVFVTMASEQFGTNIRATATTTAPNFVRGSLTLCTAAFGALAPRTGVVTAAMIVGVVVLGLALVSLRSLEETYGKDLNFLE